MIRRFLAVLGLVALLGPVHGQEPAVSSSAAIPAPFRSYIAVDNRWPLADPRNRQDKMHCLVCENSLAPVVAIFSKSVPKDAGEPLGKLMQAVQPLIPKYRGDRFGSYVIFLRTDAGSKEAMVKQPDGSEKKETLDREYPDDDRTKEVPMSNPVKYTFERETELETIRGADPKTLGGFAAAVATPNIPMGLAASKSKLTEAFGVPDDADGITVVLYNRLFIVKSWKLKPAELDDATIAEIVAEAEKTIKGLGK